MGKAFSNLARRTGQRYNAENRAQKVLQKQAANPIPKVAPKHPSTAALIENFQQAHPEYLEEQKKKHIELDKRLEGLIVNPDKLGEIVSATRPLPTDRRPVEDSEYGYLEPTETRPGFCSIKQALQFIGDYNHNFQEYTADRIAGEYNLEKAKVQKILKYYQVLQIQFPSDSKAAVLADQYQAQKARMGLPPKSPLIDISEDNLPEETEKLGSAHSTKSMQSDDTSSEPAPNHQPYIKR